MENVGQACKLNKRSIVMGRRYEDFVAADGHAGRAMDATAAGDDTEDA